MVYHVYASWKECEDWGDQVPHPQVNGNSRNYKANVKEDEI